MGSITDSEAFNVPRLSLQLSCMWEDVRWLRQSMSVSMSSSSTLQARHKMLTAAGQLQVRTGKRRDFCSNAAARR